MSATSKGTNEQPLMEAQPYTMESQSSPIVFLGLLGLFTASIGTTSIHLYRLDNPDAFSFLPQVTFAQSITLCGICIVIMALQIYHSLFVLQLLSLHMPVQPSKIPFIGHGILFMNDSPWDVLLKWHKRFGRIFCFPLMGRTCVSIADPEYLKLVLQSKIQHVKKDVDFSYQPFLVILGRGIITSEGHSWMKQRLKMSATLRHDILNIIPTVTLKAVQRLMLKLDEASTASTGTQQQQSIEIEEAFRHLTLQVISKAFLSLTAEESDSNFATMYLPIVSECNLRVWQPWRAFCVGMPFWWNHYYNVYRLNSFVSTLIQTRWTERAHGIQRENDILDVLLDAHGSNEKLTSSDIRQMRDEMKSFILAGHETSAAMLTWALYELMANQKLMNEVAAEGEAIFGKNIDWTNNQPIDLPSKDELDKLVVAEGTLKESLRKYSVVPLTVRRCIKPIEMGPYTLPKGATLLINIQAIHHDPKIWPNPMTFDPHRFIDQRPEPYTFLPFLDGPRNCLGQYLALLESKMVLSLLTQRYHFEIADGETIQTDLHGGLDIDPRHRYIIPVSVKKELLVKVTRK